MRIPKRVTQAPQVEQLRSNFYIIRTEHGHYYQSYSSVVAYWDYDKSMWFFGPDHDFSATTNRHLKESIGLTVAERREMINNKTAILVKDM